MQGLARKVSGALKIPGGPKAVSGRKAEKISDGKPKKLVKNGYIDLLGRAVILKRDLASNNV
jgi:hypothetical protein